MTSIFHGLDFANVDDHHGQCWIIDEGSSLSASFEQPTNAAVRCAVDCPFGTSRGFQALLCGEDPGESNDGFKTRGTERLLREHIANYLIVADWQSREQTPGGEFKGVSFFHKTAHIQPSIGMVIVPALLAWLTASGTEGNRLKLLSEARLARGPVVEAHPRLFLYSAIERIRRLGGLQVPINTLGTIAGYKGKGAVGVEGRRVAHDLLLSHAHLWLPRGTSRVLTSAGMDRMLENDHAFDAWLSALTAWAHEQGDTWGWSDAGLTEEEVAIEGHILILRPVT